MKRRTTKVINAGIKYAGSHKTIHPVHAHMVRFASDKDTNNTVSQDYFTSHLVPAVRHASTLISNLPISLGGGLAVDLLLSSYPQELQNDIINKENSISPGKPNTLLPYLGLTRAHAAIRFLFHYSEINSLTSRTQGHGLVKRISSIRERGKEGIKTQSERYIPATPKDVEHEEDIRLLKKEDSGNLINEVHTIEDYFDLFAHKFRTLDLGEEVSLRPNGTLNRVIYVQEELDPDQVEVLSIDDEFVVPFKMYSPLEISLNHLEIPSINVANPSYLYCMMTYHLKKNPKTFEKKRWDLHILENILKVRGEWAPVEERLNSYRH